MAPVCCAAVVLAPFAIHLAIEDGRFVTVASALAALDVVTVAALTLRRQRGRRLAAGVILALILLALLALRAAWPNHIGPVGLLATACVSHTLIYASLLALFGRSLLPGRTDLVTGLALRVRGALSPDMRLYTRSVTKVWCSFFAGQLIGSAALLAFAPREDWSMFVNVLDAPLALALFTGEYLVRRWRFRGMQHISPLETVRVFTRSRVSNP